MPVIIVKRPLERLKASNRTKTAPKPKTRGKAPSRAPKKPPVRRHEQYLFHRIKIEDEKPRMTHKQFHQWWMRDSGPEKQTPFEKTREDIAYEQYKTTGIRFLKPFEKGYGVGTDFPPGYEPPKAVKGKSSHKGKFRLKVPKRP